ncbi:protein SULFUR DEFICIENCY-INDUCED 2-like [Lotus japonicus]|uniref:protein SULFUR DEFICIENCY-INDUCED 2-like n=1 Tax=Lotus japonicus TaxID=34305 RepID=UPI00258B9C50|nr:protein SULFUR DEFICIENCY-INDUCED 2-like [Lotus japonicus]
MVLGESNSVIAIPCTDTIKAIKFVFCTFPASKQDMQNLCRWGKSQTMGANGYLGTHFDNVLIDLYKKCGKIDEQMDLLKKNLKLIYEGEAFNGKLTKTARSHGKKFQVSIKQETSRLLGNLGWAYMQKLNYVMAEAVYRKAQMIDPDCNKACNLGHCLIKQARYEEAQSIIEEVLRGNYPGSDDSKSKKRAQDLLTEISQTQAPHKKLTHKGFFIKGLEQLINEWGPIRSRRLPSFEEISSFRDQLAC